MKNWVDFSEVREHCSMTMILDHYGVNWLRKSGDELRGRCPIHEGSEGRSFHVNVKRNIFNCFNASCGVKGSVIDFTMAMVSAPA